MIIKNNIPVTNKELFENGDYPYFDDYMQRHLERKNSKVEYFESRKARDLSFHYIWDYTSNCSEGISIEWNDFFPQEDNDDDYIMAREL